MSDCLFLWSISIHTEGDIGDVLATICSFTFLMCYLNLLWFLYWQFVFLNTTNLPLLTFYFAVYTHCICNMYQHFSLCDFCQIFILHLKLFPVWFVHLLDNCIFCLYLFVLWFDCNIMFLWQCCSFLLSHIFNCVSTFL